MHWLGCTTGKLRGCSALDCCCLSGNTILSHELHSLSVGRTLPFFGDFANTAFAVGVCVFTLCLVIPPTYNVWYHTLPFIGYIISRFLIVLALCLEEWDTLPSSTKTFIFIYGSISHVFLSSTCRSTPTSPCTGPRVPGPIRLPLFSIIAGSQVSPLPASFFRVVCKLHILVAIN